MSQIMDEIKKFTIADSGGLTNNGDAIALTIAHLAEQLKRLADYFADPE